MFRTMFRTDLFQTMYKNNMGSIWGSRGRIVKKHPQKPAFTPQMSLCNASTAFIPCEAPQATGWLGGGARTP